MFLSKSEKLKVKIVNKDVVLFKAVDQEKNYSESAIIDRKSGELIHEITRNIKSENSEKDISFYSCSKMEEKVWFFFKRFCVKYYYEKIYHYYNFNFVNHIFCIC